MEKRGLLTNSRCYIELGAGKGGLTERINGTDHLRDIEFVIIDRATSRIKKERKVEKHKFERVKIDIADFNIEKVNTKFSVIGIAKHLCGR